MSSLRPNSAADSRSKARFHSASTVQQLNPGVSSAFGSYSGQQQQRRPTYGNYSNMTSSTMARDNLGGYNQNMGTITQNGLRVLDGLLHNAT
jgi:hypothetical protein